MITGPSLITLPLGCRARQLDLFALCQVRLGKAVDSCVTGVADVPLHVRFSQKGRWAPSSELAGTLLYLPTQGMSPGAAS